RNQAGHAVGLEGPGRSLDQGIRQSCPLGPAILLLVDARLAGGRPEGLLFLVLVAALGRRRQDHHADRPGCARGPPRVVDRSAESRPHDPGERRRGVRDGERRQVVALSQQPADRAVLHGRRRQQLTVHVVRRPAGQQRLVRAVDERRRRRGGGRGGGGGGGGRGWEGGVAGHRGGRGQREPRP